MLVEVVGEVVWWSGLGVVEFFDVKVVFVDKVIVGNYDVGDGG